jgi:glycerate-2-kinase
MEMSESRQQKLRKIWDAAIAAVAGRQAVLNALDADSPFLPDLIIAVGKAASGMCSGALERFPGCGRRGDRVRAPDSGSAFAGCRPCIIGAHALDA